MDWVCVLKKLPCKCKRHYFFGPLPLAAGEGSFLALPAGKRSLGSWREGCVQFVTGTAAQVACTIGRIRGRRHTAKSWRRATCASRSPGRRDSGRCLPAIKAPLSPARTRPACWSRLWWWLQRCPHTQRRPRTRAARRADMQEIWMEGRARGIGEGRQGYSTFHFLTINEQ